MKKNWKKRLVRSGVLFFVFAVFTFAAAHVDRRPIGPEGSVVGFAIINGFVFELLGVNPFWYDLTEGMGMLAILCALGFGLLGLCQLVHRRSLRRVDGSLLALGGFYGLVAGVYVLFERLVINCRPMILEGVLEASYPSSHTILVVCVMATAAIQLRSLLPGKKNLCRWVDGLSAVIVVITVIGRLLSGVHWFTDIVGGVLLSVALITLYHAFAELV